MITAIVLLTYFVGVIVCYIVNRLTWSHGRLWGDVMDAVIVSLASWAFLIVFLFMWLATADWRFKKAPKWL